jgi:hypothetical protein
MNINISRNPLVRFVQAPQSYNHNIAVQGVSLFPDEEVQWHHTYINGRDNITGYTVTKRINTNIFCDECKGTGIDPKKEEPTLCPKCTSQK